MNISTFKLAISVSMWCAAVLASHAGAEDWPQWQGPLRNGISRESNLNWSWPAEGPKVLWKTSLGKGFSSFAIAQGRAFTMGNQDNVDTVFCLDAETGKELWKHSYPCDLHPKAFEGGPLSTPAVDGNRVYTLSKFGDCFCLDTETGRVIWSKKFEPPVATKADYRVWWGFAGSIAVTDDRLILAVGTSGVAVDKATGKVIWGNGAGYPGYSSPTFFKMNSRPCFAYVSGHEVVAAEVGSGSVLWKIPWKTTWDQNATDVIVHEGKLFVTSGHDVGCALFDISSGKPVQLWRNKNLRTFLGNCVLWKGCLYGFDDKQTNQMCCLDWLTGEVRWTASDLSLGTLIVADGKLVALQEKGTLLVIDARSDAYKPLTKAQVLKGRCWAVPALSDGRLFLRNAAGDAVCVSVRK